MVTPIAFDLLYKGSPQPGQLTYPALALTCLQDQPGAAALFPQTALYVAPIVAPSWLPSNAYTLGQYVTCGNPNVFVSGVNRHVYIYSGGTTGATEPVWNQTPGGTTVDGSGTWTECSLLFGAGTMTGCEPTSDPNYARAPLNNTSTIFYGDTINPNPVLRFPVAGSLWGPVVGFFVADAPTAGNVYAVGLIPSPYVMPSVRAPALFLGQPYMTSNQGMVVGRATAPMKALASGAAATQTVVIPANALPGDAINLALWHPFNYYTGSHFPTVVTNQGHALTRITPAAGMGIASVMYIEWYQYQLVAGDTSIIVTGNASAGSDAFALWAAACVNAVGLGAVYLEGSGNNDNVFPQVQMLYAIANTAGPGGLVICASWCAAATQVENPPGQPGFTFDSGPSLSPTAAEYGGMGLVYGPNINPIVDNVGWVGVLGQWYVVTICLGAA